MERTEVNVTTKICLHDVLVALDTLSKDYPMDRLAEYQIERIEGAARILRSRMKDYEDAKDSKTTTTTGTVTAVPSNVTMPSGWSFSGLTPMTVETTVGHQWNSTPAVTVMDRRVGSPSTRRTHSTSGSPTRRTGKGRRKDDVAYRGFPYAVAPQPIARRKNGDRRKVNDWAHPNRSKRVAGYGPKGRRSTDRESYTMLPNINTPPSMVETNQDRTKRRK